VERQAVESVADAVDAALRRTGEARRHVMLAALAEVSARYLEPPENFSATLSAKRKN